MSSNAKKGTGYKVIIVDAPFPSSHLHNNSALGDTERQCHVEECFNCGQLSQGYGKIGLHLGQASNLMESQARATQLGIVEDLKRHRDLLTSLLQLLQKHEYHRLDARQETIHKRIAANEAKIKSLRAPTEAAGTATGRDGPSDSSEALIETTMATLQAVRGRQFVI